MTGDDKELTLKQNVILILERFPYFKYAAKINRISEDTLIRMRKEDVDFANECEAARGRGLMKYAGRATPEFILKTADPETFRERKEVDVTSGGKPIMGGTAYVPTDDSV